MPTNVKPVDTITRRARIAKGGTFGGVAACPHCFSLFRYFVTARRRQCLLDIVAASYCAPPTPLLVSGDVDADGAYGSPSVTDVSSGRASPPDITTDGTSKGAGAPAPPLVLTYSDERGFDDDEAPFPT